MYIIFYSFKHGPSSCYILGEIEKFGLEGIGKVLKPGPFIELEKREVQGF